MIPTRILVDYYNLPGVAGRPRAPSILHSDTIDQLATTVAALSGRLEWFGTSVEIHVYGGWYHEGGA